jgi:glyoxylase-like metal-dependent hydrolase (beta-lactamase superfamily II)
MKTLDINRRRLVQGIALSGCYAALGTPALAASGKTTLGVQNLTDRISLITGAGANVVSFKGNNGQTLIDSGSQAASSALVDTAQELAGRLPVKTLFNTHWHANHTGGNEAFKTLGAQILAHENTRLWMSADFEVEWRNRHYSPSTPAALPDSTFYGSGDMDLGGEIVQYHHFPRAHTDGDIVLFFPDSNIMVTGGLMTDGSTYPVSDIATGGWMGELIAANDAMLAMADSNTVFVPGIGAPRSKADLQAQRDMLADVLDKMTLMAQDGFDASNMLEAGLTADYDAKWGDPTEFVLEAYMGFVHHSYDVGGFI